MRLICFFVLSLFLHAAAVLYPISFGGRSAAEIIQIKILPLKQESETGGAQGNESPAAASTAVKPHRAIRRIGGPAVETRSSAISEPASLTAGAPTTVDGGTASISTMTNSSENGAPNGSSPGGSANHYIIGGGGAGIATGVGSPGTGVGRGSTSGNGSGSSGTVIALTEASYRHTPRPVYPESARHEGREGRVLLRVLIDDQGKTKQVEINQSSGSDALDRAATEAIKRWRFHPARYGDQPVESWLRIPIEFRLADAKS